MIGVSMYLAPWQQGVPVVSESETRDASDSGGEIFSDGPLKVKVFSVKCDCQMGNLCLADQVL